jgi:hypothetical protein
VSLTSHTNCADQEEVARLTLPQSGFDVLARKLAPLAAQAVTEKCREIADCSGPFSALDKWSEIVAHVLVKVLIEPKCGLIESKDVIHPGWLFPNDRLFLVFWGLGLIDSEGRMLADATVRPFHGGQQGRYAKWKM